MIRRDVLRKLDKVGWWYQNYISSGSGSTISPFEINLKYFFQTYVEIDTIINVSWIEFNNGEEVLHKGGNTYTVLQFLHLLKTCCKS